MTNQTQDAIQLPPYNEGNEGYGHSFRVAFSDGEKEWEEEIKLLDLLAQALADSGINYQQHEDFLLLLDDLILQPQILSFSPRDDGNVSTATSIQINSAKELPSGLFEYQHSIGEDLEDSLIQGFIGWINSDLQTLIESIQGLANCTSMQMKFPERELTRQIVLGPVTHYSSQPSSDDEHSFCPCCFFTKNVEAFKSFTESDQLIGIRFFASRSETGEITADCRVNGLDFEAGKAALLEYGKSWPGEGFEFRKQYVVMRNKVV